jgi:hypothetical protein
LENYFQIVRVKTMDDNLNSSLHVEGFGTGESDPFKDANNKMLISHDPCFPEEQCLVEESQGVLMARAVCR